ncbi:MAG: bifunctional ([pyruvate, phosphate dikinase] phosphate) phosphotransferase/[pyruvate, phosphate dikinase] kinase [Bdellovibrionaceae bacterium]|nr:bifunctional ([pyruvate, phosphate dikinase] phosphate) phosphotransferase/[pyruvate, phosphate dikinase] kinase [Pseudobdellovibrionaceae bacterium]|tara:strand:+ start:36045 stop:36890 length:846 start_codon:yes stop_codon:yes gene_type:complete
MEETLKPSIFIISDGTGETASAMTRAALVQFRQDNINIVRCKNIRTPDQVDALIEDVFQKRGFVVHTVVSQDLRDKIQSSCSEKGLPCTDLLGPLLTNLQSYLNAETNSEEAGLLRTVDQRYFKRIEAIEYTVKHDDGKLLTDLDLADIILVGISRTSKTPLSIYLSHKGWKVANIPMVLNQKLPDELFAVDQRKIVGLVIDQESLLRIRRKRLEKFGQDPGGEYASLSHIQKEIDFAHEVYRKNRKWPVFDVTDRALEETAGEIIRIVASRMDIPYHVLL